ncbi:MAG: glucose 1-dehydrogenase [Dehalococcoidales bacterium]|jgi:gluconate 5-dehydrogenase|nr:glucose 1-dehydrogenase [Dehalococcoidales bacterium]
MDTYDKFNIKGKVALVTGGGRGIGKCMAQGLAEAGVDLIITSRKQANLENTAAELTASCGVKVQPVVCDLGRLEEIDKLVDFVKDSDQKIDILLNNAGLTWGAPTLEYPIEKWDQLFNVNVRGAWYLTQKIVTLMKEQGGGNVINVSSIWAYRGAYEEIHPALPYNATKAAISSLTMNLAVKLAPYNIRVNAIAPGLFPEGMMAYVQKEGFEEDYAELLKMLPMRRYGEPDDLKAVPVFLASDAASYITGHVLVVDGGFLSR